MAGSKLRGWNMEIKVKLLGPLRSGRFTEKMVDYPSGTQVEEVLDALQIKQRSFGIILINGKHARISSSLQEGDTLSVLPLLSGG